MTDSIHPETEWRLDHIRGFFAPGEDQESALSLVEETLRQLSGEIAQAALVRHIPAGGVDGEVSTDFTDGGGRRFTVKVASDDGKRDLVTATLSVHAPRSWDASNFDEVATVSAFGIDGPRPRLMGRVYRDEEESVFRFAAADFPAVAEPLSPDVRSLYRNDDVEAAIAADGGVPKERTRTLLATHLALVQTLVLRHAADNVAGLARAQAAAGLEWGKAYLAYDDTDKRTTSVPCADGRTAIFHENIDLCSDHSSYLLATRPGDGGEPASVELWLLERYKTSTPEAVAAFAAGGEAPAGAVRFSLDLATGELDQPSDLDDSGMRATLWYGVQNDLWAIGELGTGTLELGGYNKVRTDFDAFEREPDEDEEDEDEEDEDEEDEDDLDGDGVPTP